MKKSLSVSFYCSFFALMLMQSAVAQPFAEIERQQGKVRALDKPEMLVPHKTPKLPAIPKISTGIFSSGSKVYVSAFQLYCGESSAVTDGQHSTLNCPGLVVDKRELLDLVSPYEGTVLTGRELLSIRDQITDIYQMQGYITSGAHFPIQDVSDGVVAIQLIQGRLSRLDIRGLQQLKASYVESRFGLESDVLEKQALGSRFQQLINDPNILKIDGSLYPSGQPGESVFGLDIVESDPSSYRLSTSNDISPSVGGVRVQFNGSWRNLIGYGDVWSMTLAKAKGYKEAELSGHFELPKPGLSVWSDLSVSRSDVVEDDLEDLDISSDSHEASVGVRYAFVKAIDSEWALAFEVKKKDTQSYFLGLPFSFSPGSNKGHTQLWQMIWSFSGMQRFATKATAFRLSLTYGLDSSTPNAVNPLTPEENYLFCLLQVQHVMSMSHGIRLSARVDLQLTNDILYSSDQFSLGGRNSVRGYREQSLHGDNAVSTSIELIYPWLSTEFGYARKDVSLMGFLDSSYGWDTKTIGPEREEWISGAGVGVRWDYGEASSVALYAAKAFNSLPGKGDDLQDNGLYFDITWGF